VEIIPGTRTNVNSDVPQRGYVVPLLLKFAFRNVSDKYKKSVDVTKTSPIQLKNI
jgi:hypothetical protein